MKAVDVVIMAAGKGTRMKSTLAKVLQPLAGKALLGHVIDSASQLGARSINVVVGHAAAQVQEYCSELNDKCRIATVLQEPQLGTGHAASKVAPYLADDGIVLLLNGDVPLVKVQTLSNLVQLCREQSQKWDGAIALLTVDEGKDAGGYGRIVRGAFDGSSGRASVRAIVEAKDANIEQKRITEWYSGVMALPAKILKKYLPLLDNNNAQGEWYLTDLIKHAVSRGVHAYAMRITDSAEVEGVNTLEQLAGLERQFQRKIAKELMDAGTRLADPARIDIRGQFKCGRDVFIDVGCVFEENVEIQDGAHIGAYSVISNAVIKSGAKIKPFSHISGDKLGVEIGSNAEIGPFARLRAGAQIGENVHIGNFVEVKNANLAAGAKANHLAYIGDAQIGANVNYGAGCITANYDGANKHKTQIKQNAHIGSNSVLVAPVTIGEGATIAAGSVITENAPQNQLTIARAKGQISKQWQRPQKNK